MIAHLHPPKPIAQPSIRTPAEPLTQTDHGLEDLDLGLELKLALDVVRRDMSEVLFRLEELCGKRLKEVLGGPTTDLRFETGCDGELPRTSSSRQRGGQSGRGAGSLTVHRSLTWRWWHVTPTGGMSVLNLSLSLSVTLVVPTLTVPLGLRSRILVLPIHLLRRRLLVIRWLLLLLLWLLTLRLLIARLSVATGVVYGFGGVVIIELADQFIEETHRVAGRVFKRGGMVSVLV